MEEKGDTIIEQEDLSPLKNEPDNLSEEIHQSPLKLDSERILDIP
jgi:hypothetical protein